MNKDFMDGVIIINRRPTPRDCWNRKAGQVWYFLNNEEFFILIDKDELGSKWAKAIYSKEYLIPEEPTKCNQCKRPPYNGL